MTETTKSEPKIPSWLFFPIYNDSYGGNKWTKEKQQLAQRILKSINNHAISEYWGEKTIKQITKFNRDDDVRGYYQQPIE